MNPLHKLGSGAFANVYLSQYGDKKVAIKIPNDILSKKETHRFLKREIHILKRLTKSKYILNMIDYKVTNDEKYITTELLSGDSLDILIDYFDDNDTKMPLSIVKTLSRQILSGLAELSSKNIIHNDLKPENILFVEPLHKFIKPNKHLAKIPDNIESLLLQSCIKIVDFGGAYMRPIKKRHQDDFYRSKPTRYYISPQRLVKAPVWVEADMWSFGCIFYEFITGNVLFNPDRNNSMGVNTMHLAMIIKVFGPIPKKLIVKGNRYKRYFVDSGIHRFDYLIPYIDLDCMEDLLYDEGVAESDIPSILNFMMPMFEYDPKKRITAAKCLKSKFLDLKVLRVLNQLNEIY